MKTSRTHHPITSALLLAIIFGLSQLTARSATLERTISADHSAFFNLSGPEFAWTSPYVVDTHSDTLTFEQTAIPLTGIHGGNASWFDYDDDGDLDILLSGSSDSGYVTKIYRNDGGTFVPNGQTLVGVAPEHTAVWGDYDNDGDFDFFIAGVHSDTGGVPGSPVSKIYRNDHGTFVDINAPIMGLRGGSAAWGDYDNDGDLDLIVTGSPDNGSTFKTTLYRNDGGEFTAVPGTPFPGVWGASVAWGDFDNDGDIDLLMSGWGVAGAMTKLFENAGGEFREVSTPFLDVASSAVAFADYDNDGDLDVVITGTVAGGSAVTKLYRNNGDGTFTDTNAPLLGLGVGAIAWGDIDNDGDLDLVISGSQTFGGTALATIAYRNDGGTFTELPDVLPGGWFSSLSFGDYDKDGRLDLLFSGATSNVGDYRRKTIIYRNIYPPQNSIPVIPANLSASVIGNSVQFSWDRSSDDHTAQKALTYNLRVGLSPGAIDVLSPNSNVATGFRRVPLPGNANSDTSIQLTHFSPGTYYWSVQSVDNGYLGSGFATERSFTILGTANWQMISLPYAYADYKKSVLFPNAVSNAFSYDGTYHISAELSNGPGYWLKFSPASPRTILSGSTMDSISIPVKAGWNMIGSLSTPLPVSSVVPVGTTIRSPYFGYDGAYVMEDTISPGSGYWIKVGQTGSLILSTTGAGASPGAGKPVSSATSMEEFNVLTFENASGCRQQLFFGKACSNPFPADWYELPPVPPQAGLDVRFATQRILEVNDGASPSELPINITSSSYPLTISWSIKDPVPGVMIVGEQSASVQKNGTLRVGFPGERVSLRFQGGAEQPRTFSLEQNFPNPFNPATTVSFVIGTSSHVRLRIFDVLGREVARLIDEKKEPGAYTVSWDAANFSSGMYFYELSAGSFRDVKKMTLVK